MKASWLVRRPHSCKWQMKIFLFFIQYSSPFLNLSFLVRNTSISYTKKPKPCPCSHVDQIFCRTVYVFKKLILWQIIMFCPDFLRRTEKRWLRWGDSTRYFIMILRYLIPINPQEILNVEGGPNESMSIMYGTLLRKYEAIKDDFGLVSKRWYF